MGRWSIVLAAVMAMGLDAADADAMRATVDARQAIAGGEYARVRLAGAVEADLRVVVLPPGRHRAQAIAAEAQRDAFAAARAVDGAVVVINGGYFDRERRHLGWLRVEGVELAPRAAQAPFSGVAFADDGPLRLAPAADAPAARAVIQAGPFLVDPGGTLGIRRDGGDGARRSALAVCRDGTVLAVAAAPITLRGFAQALLALPPALDLQPVEAALNLDGGPSTGLQVDGIAAASVAPRGFVVSAWVFTAP